MSKIPDWKLIFAVVTVAVVWGTTFLGIKLAVETMQPWYVAGLRQLLAAVLLLIYLFVTRQLRWIGTKEAGIQFMLSALMLIGANGLTTVAETHVTSNLASLVSSLSPLLVFIGSLIVGLEKFTLKSAAGLLLGFGGVVFIFWHGVSQLAEPSYRLGIILLFLSILCWAAGTIYSKKISIQNNNMFLNLFYQFAFAGVVQTVIALFLYGKPSVEIWSGKSIAATVYLAIFGSVAAYFTFNYALTKLKPTQVSMLSYINTVIAIFLGWLVLDEPVTYKFVIATALIISGVFIMNYKPSDSTPK